MYLSIDIGTSRLKAALAAGGSFWVEQRTLRLIKNGPRAEQDPDEWLQGLQELLPRLLSKAAVSSDAIEPLREQPFPSWFPWMDYIATCG